MSCCNSFLYNENMLKLIEVKDFVSNSRKYFYERSNRFYAHTLAESERLHCFFFDCDIRMHRELGVRNGIRVVKSV